MLLTELPPIDAGKQVCYDVLHRIVQPVLDSARQGRLHDAIPLAGPSGRDGRTTALEALARTLCGSASVLELNHVSAEDLRFGRSTRGADARLAIELATDPDNPAWLRFNHSQQDLVECALLAVALLRAPTALWESLSPRAQANVIRLLQQSRSLMPVHNNWVLFPAVIEAFFIREGLPHEIIPIEYALRQLDQWYLGDGVYKDGNSYHLDYYNSIIIHPLLLEIQRAVEGRHIHPHWTAHFQQAQARASLHAGDLIKFIHQDGFYPRIGRSLTYRAGVFHLLSQMLLLGYPVPESSAHEVSQAISRTIAATLQPAANYDALGWLQIGITGRQEHMAEPYISTGSLYFATNAFLHLGVPSDDPLWTGALSSA